MKRREFFHRCAALTFVGAVSQRAASRPNINTRIFHHPACLQHWTGQDHPEQPSRVEAVLTAMRALEAEGVVTLREARLALDEEILLVHSHHYLGVVKEGIRRGDRQLSTGDTVLSKGSLTAARAAVGCVLSAVDAVMTGDTKNAFCAVRPPGHHASSERGMGFCLFNNVAIAARYAQRKYRIQRVLIADWDVHHGNGTQDIFWRDKSVLFFDTHLDPWYPGTGKIEEIGEGEARGHIINRPYPVGSGGEQILKAYREVLLPAAQVFKPDLVLVSAGFDSRMDDPLGGFRLTDQDYGDMTDVVVEIARRYAGGRVVSALEGGYNLRGLASATSAHVRRLSAA